MAAVRGGVDSTRLRTDAARRRVAGCLRSGRRCTVHTPTPLEGSSAEPGHGLEWGQKPVEGQVLRRWQRLRSDTDPSMEQGLEGALPGLDGPTPRRGNAARTEGPTLPVARCTTSVVRRAPALHACRHGACRHLGVGWQSDGPRFSGTATARRGNLKGATAAVTQHGCRRVASSRGPTPRRREGHAPQSASAGSGANARKAANPRIGREMQQAPSIGKGPDRRGRSQRRGR